MPQSPAFEHDPSPEPPGLGLAITAFVLAMLGLLFVCGPIGLAGLILGIVALVKANATPPRAGGKGFAIASIAVGGVSILVSILVIPLLIGIMLPAFAQARESAQRLKASADMRQMSHALVEIANNNNGQFPDSADGWQQRLIDTGFVTPDMFVSPRTDGVGDDYFYVPGYTDDFDATGVLIYEDPDLDPDGTLIGYRDSHVEYVPQTQATRILSALTLPDGTPYAPHDEDRKTFTPPVP